jgi:hypothetical protein
MRILRLTFALLLLAGPLSSCTEDEGVCGNGVTEADETCDDGNTVTELCEYGLDSCAVCNEDCEIVAGVTTFCGDGGITSPHEECDNGNNPVAECRYGQLSCDVCGAECSFIAGVTHYCGDGSLDDGNSEICDDGNSDAWDGCHECELRMFLGASSAGYITSSDVAVRGDGSFVITWQGADADGAGVLARVFDALGHPLADGFVVNTTTAGNQVEPQAAVDGGSGTFVITWQGDSQDATGTNIYGQRFAPDGMPAGGEFTINETLAGDQSRPAIAASPVGDFFVAWSGPGNGGPDVYGKLFNAQGTGVTGEMAISSLNYGQGRPKVAMNASGDIIVAFTSYTPATDNVIMVQRFDSAGNSDGSGETIHDTSLDPAFVPSVALTDDGDALVAWHSQPTSGPSSILTSVHDGSSWSPHQIAAPNAGQPHAAINPADGGFVLTWVGESTTEHISLQRYDSTGAPLGSPMVPHQPGSYQFTSPASGCEASGGVVVVWAGETSLLPETSGVFIQRLSATDAVLGHAAW